MIRFGNMEDIEQVNIIRKEVNELHVNGAPNIFKPGFSKDMIEYVNSFIDNEDKMLIVYEVKNQIYAYAMIQFVTKPETPYRYELKFLEIQELGTLKDKQGNGYGKEIIQQIKEIAKEKGISRIELNMWSFNEKALKFYESMGFNTYRRYLNLEI